MSQPDASHLFITIEEIFRKHQLRSTRRLHPIIGIKRDKKGKIIDILPPNESFERRSWYLLRLKKYLIKIDSIKSKQILIFT